MVGSPLVDKGHDPYNHFGKHFFPDDGYSPADKRMHGWAAKIRSKVAKKFRSR